MSLEFVAGVWSQLDVGDLDFLCLVLLFQNKLGEDFCVEKQRSTR